MWIGVDGGATKTEALVVDQTRVAGFFRAGPSNHQGVGMDNALREIWHTVSGALQDAGTTLDRVQGAVLGLAGADFPEDIQRLVQGLAPLFGQTPFRVVNDSEIALHAGSNEGWGIVAIAGTGTNVLGRTPDGVIRQVGGLGYEYGDYGSGIDMARDVLHHAFRSAECRGPKTSLEDVVLATFGVQDFLALSRAIYFQEIAPEAYLMLAPLCFQAARENDAVAMDILRRQGRAVGESIVGCARLLKLEGVALDVILAGSLWLGSAPHMRDALMQTVTSALPLARVELSELRPVAGAALMAASFASGLREVLREDVRFRGVE